jgi:hypothetical protein
MSLMDDPHEFQRHVAAQHRERAALESRRKDQQTTDQRIAILAAAIDAGIRVAPDLFLNLDSRRAATLVVETLL